MSTTSNEFAKHFQDWAGPIRGKSEAKPAGKIKKAADRAQAIVRQGMEAVNTARRQVCDTAVHASGSVVAFTKANPIKTILMAGASGALLMALFNAQARKRD